MTDHLQLLRAISLACGSQAKAARRLGCSPQVVTHYFKGRAQIPAQTARRIEELALELGVDRPRVVQVEPESPALVLPIEPLPDIPSITDATSALESARTRYHEALRIVAQAEAERAWSIWRNASTIAAAWLREIVRLEKLVPAQAPARRLRLERPAPK